MTERHLHAVVGGMINADYTLPQIIHELSDTLTTEQVTEAYDTIWSQLIVGDMIAEAGAM